jgi:hypothetical protein
MDRHFCTAHLQRGLERRRCFATGSACGDRLGMRAAYHADSALEAQALLEALAHELDKTTQVPPAASATASPKR